MIIRLLIIAFMSLNLYASVLSVNVHDCVDKLGDRQLEIISRGERDCKAEPFRVSVLRKMVSSCTSIDPKLCTPKGCSEVSRISFSETLLSKSKGFLDKISYDSSESKCTISTRDIKQVLFRPHLDIENQRLSFFKSDGEIVSFNLPVEGVRIVLSSGRNPSTSMILRQGQNSISVPLDKLEEGSVSMFRFALYERGLSIREFSPASPAWPNESKLFTASEDDKISRILNMSLHVNPVDYSRRRLTSTEGHYLVLKGDVEFFVRSGKIFKKLNRFSYTHSYEAYKSALESRDGRRMPNALKDIVVAGIFTDSLRDVYIPTSTSSMDLTAFVAD